MDIKTSVSGLKILVSAEVIVLLFVLFVVVLLDSLPAFESRLKLV